MFGMRACVRGVFECINIITLIFTTFCTVLHVSFENVNVISLAKICCMISHRASVKFTSMANEYSSSNTICLKTRGISWLSAMIVSGVM